MSTKWILDSGVGPSGGPGPVINEVQCTDMSGDYWAEAIDDVVDGAHLALPPPPAGTDVYLYVFDPGLFDHPHPGVIAEGFTGSLDAGEIYDTGATLIFENATVTATQIDATFDVDGGSLQAQTASLLESDYSGSAASVLDGGSVTLQSVVLGSYNGIFVGSGSQFTADSISYVSYGSTIQVYGIFSCGSTLDDPAGLGVYGGNATIQGDFNNENSADGAYVAYGGSLKITGALYDTDLIIGDAVYGSGDVSVGGNVSGSTVRLEAQSSLKVGGNYYGSLTLALGSQATIGGFISLGLETTGNDQVLVETGSTLTVQNLLDVGFDGTGSLIVSSSDLEVHSDLRVAVEAGSKGSSDFGGVTTGYGPFGGSVTIEGNFYVGAAGTATSLIDSGATTTVDGDLLIGDLAGSSGDLTVTGDGTSLIIHGSAYIAGDGVGALAISNGGGAKVGGDLDEAVYAGSSSTTDIGDAGATLTIDGDYNVGEYGTATDTIGGGVTVAVGGAIDIGVQASGVGSVTVSDQGSTLQGGSGDVIIGIEGAGALTVKNQGMLIANGDVIVGAQATGTGTVTIDIGGTADIGGSLTIGQEPTGPGESAFGTGDVKVDGSGSKLTAADITVGGLAPDQANPNNGENGIWTYVGGVGALEVSDDASVMTAGDLTLQVKTETGDSGVLTADGGIGITSGGGVEVGGDSAAPADTLRIADGASLTGHGRITGAVTGEVPVSDSTTAPTYSLSIDNQGTIRADNGTLVLDGNVSGGGQFLIGADSTLEFGGTVADDVTAMFLPGGDETIAIDDPNNFKGVISSENFEPGDKIDLTNVPYIDPGAADLNPDGASYYFETGEGQSNYVLQVVMNDQTYDIQISEDAPLSGGFTLSDDGRGGTLVTHTDDAVTGYSVTASADGPAVQSYDGVVKIIGLATEKKNSVVGSGFAVAGGPSDLILTAGHVVFQTDTTYRVYTPSGGYKLGYVVAAGSPLIKIAIPVFGDHFEPRSNDWAYLEVPGLNFTPTQQFKIFFPSFSGGQVRVSGYPGVKNVIGITPQNTEEGTVEANGQFFTYTGNLKNIAAGESGGPTWILRQSGSIETSINEEADVVGINITGDTALNVAKIPFPSEIHGPFKLYTDPPANAPRITSAVVVESGDADTGKAVQFILSLSENVTVTGAGPTLTLNDGGVATYNAAKSTGTELEFDYTVGAGDLISNLAITQVNSTQTVQARGGAIVDFTVLDNQPTNLSINSPLAVTSVASSQNGQVSAGQFVQLTLTMSEAVTVNAAGGAPTLLLNDNAVATYDAGASNPSAGKLVFDYAVGGGDETANLAIASVNLPTGTTIRDAAGYNADFSGAASAPTGLQVGPAYIAAITAITPSQSGDLTTGQTLQLTLAMSQGVTVGASGGSPTLSLSDGAVATYDAAASNAAAGTLVFDYAVGAGDYTTDLQVLGYNANGVTVTDAHGVNADLSGATQADLALHVNAAVVTKLAVSPSVGEAESGRQVTLTLTMSEPVSVNLTGGSPTLSLDGGAAATYDSAASNPSAGTLVFDYVVGSSDKTPGLQISQVVLNGATIDDANGNAADFSMAAGFTTNLQIGPAFVSAVTPSLSGEIFTGQTDHLMLAMSQGVTVDTTIGSPTLSLSDGAVATYDAAASDPSSGALVFDYTVGANDYTTDLTVLGYNPNGATVTDANGVNADFSGVAHDDPGLDVNAAIITDVASSPSSGEVGGGAHVAVTLTMSEAVTVDTTNGSPTLSLSDVAVATYDAAASDPSSGALVFDYTVGATDETPNLQVIKVKLNGATIKDANGNAADLSAVANFDTGLQIGPVFVDQFTPSLSGDIATGQTVQLSVSMSAGLTVDTANGSPTLGLSNGAAATYDALASSPSRGNLVFDYTVGAGDYAIGLSVVGFSANGALVADANGVSPDFSGLTQSDLGLDVNATTVVNVAASPSTGAALSGQKVLLTLTMSEPLTVNTTAGSPTLYLSDGAIAAYDSPASNPSAGTLVFDFTVGAGDYTPNLAIAKVNLHGAIVTDGQGNAPDFGAALGANTGLEIDPACFCRGTLIRTPDGEAPVETLQRGDRVMTTDGVALPISWIGLRRVSALFADPVRCWPIRVKAGALAENVPSRDLLLSPDHALLVGDVLIQVGALVNGTSIVRETSVPQLFTYYHVELDDHSLILAENTPAETFVDNVDRLGFDNWAEHEALYPDGKPVEELPFPRAKSRRQIPMNIRATLDSRVIALRAEENMAVA